MKKPKKTHLEDRSELTTQFDSRSKKHRRNSSDLESIFDLNFDPKQFNGAELNNDQNFKSHER